MKNYYSVLEIDENASEEDIKKAYRRLAQQYHPDKSKDSESSAEKFKEINEAYTTLSNKDKRKEYDFSRNVGGGIGFDNIFGDMFGFGDIFGRRSTRRQPKRNLDPSIRFELPLSELEKGEIEHSFAVKRDVKCEKCDGRGGDKVETCGECGGSGQLLRNFKQGNMRFQSSYPCGKCKSSGKIIIGMCLSCKGEGHVVRKDKYNVTIKCTKQ